MVSSLYDNLKGILMKYFITIIVIAFLITACNGSKKVMDGTGNVQLSGTYRISSISNKAVSENAPTLNFIELEKSVRGNTGCNDFFGNYTIDHSTLSFNDIGSTEMACEQPIMDIENAFLQALQKTGSYDIENSVLTLYSKNDRSIILVAIKKTASKD